jgi:hypothetical protein
VLLIFSVMLLLLILRPAALCICLRNSCFALPACCSVFGNTSLASNSRRLAAGGGFAGPEEVCDSSVSGVLAAILHRQAQQFNVAPLSFFLFFDSLLHDDDLCTCAGHNEATAFCVVCSKSSWQLHLPWLISAACYHPLPLLHLAQAGNHQHHLLSVHWRRCYLA